MRPPRAVRAVLAPGASGDRRHGRNLARATARAELREDRRDQARAAGAARPRGKLRFLDEARLVATLEHPNIAQVYEIGAVNGMYFFVMEYIDGADVRRLIETSIAKR